MGKLIQLIEGSNRKVDVLYNGKVSQKVFLCPPEQVIIFKPGIVTIFRGLVM